MYIFIDNFDFQFGETLKFYDSKILSRISRKLQRLFANILASIFISLHPRLHVLEMENFEKIAGEMILILEGRID